MFYVYELLDPRDGSVFYVGKGKRDRIDAHEKEARAGKRGGKADRIREIEAAGLSVVKRKVARFGNAVDALRHEAGLVEHYGLDRLTNVLPGGSGAVKFSQADDAEFVANFAKLVRRTGGLDVGLVWVFGIIRVDLKPAIARLERHLKSLMNRRGREWVDAISDKHDVQFI
jgi:hypothetical protein